MIIRSALSTLALLLGVSASHADTISLNPRVIQVGKWAEGISVEGSSVWVAESGQRTIAQFNLGQGSLMRRVTVGRLPVNMTTGTDGTLYTLVQTDKLIWQQPANGAKGKALGGLEGCPSGLDFADAFLWVLTEPDCSSATGRVIRVDPHGGAPKSSGMIGEMSQAIAVGWGKAWIAHSRGQALSVLDESTLAIQKANVQGASLWTITANGDSVYVGGRLGEGGSQGIVASVNPSSMQETKRQIVDQPISFIANDNRNVVAVGEKGRIFVFAVNGLQLLRTINMPNVKFSQDGGPRAVTIQGDTLYISSGQQFGENGAVLILSGWRPAGLPAPSPAPSPVPPPAAGVTDCPYQVVNVGDATGIWMYQDPDVSASKVMAVPADSKGLVADRCLTTWCHVTFHGASGWVQRNHIKAYCD